MAKGDFHERGSEIKEFGLPSYKGIDIYVQKYEIFWNKCKMILIRRCSSVGERQKPKSQTVRCHSSGQRAKNHLIPGKGWDQPALEAGCPGQMLVHFATRKLHFRKTEISPDIY